MFEALGRFVFRRRWPVLIAALISTAIAVAWGAGIFSSSRQGGFEPPANTESMQARQLAADTFGRSDADVVVLYSSDDRTIDDSRFRDAIVANLTALPSDKVTSITTYWTSNAPAFVSEDRKSTYAIIQLVGEDDSARLDSYEAIKNDLTVPELDTQLGGMIGTNSAVSEQIDRDLSRAESLSMPVLLVLLVVIFGSVAAASLPLAIGGIAIVGSFAALRTLGEFTDISIFAINLTTVLGLGLAIDYGLFMVSRFREELRRNTNTEDALAITMATAGRTVAVSGITVALSLASLLLFPQMFLRSMGYGGIATVAVDLLAALTVLPALLAVLGHRVDALSLRPLMHRLLRRPQESLVAQLDRSTAAKTGSYALLSDHRGAWFRIAHSVMRRPVIYLLTIVIGLLVLGSPFRHIVFGGNDARILQEEAPARQVSETLDRDFPRNSTTPIDAIVTLSDSANASEHRATLTSYTDQLQRLPGVTGADITAESGDVARVSVRYEAEPISQEARDLVADIRAIPAPEGGQVLVGGVSAQLVDQLHSLGNRLPWMAAMVAITTFALLLLAFGSILLPLKAIVVNVLSLSATFGALVWIFQDGHLASLLDFTPLGSIEPSSPILVLAIVFGLSMDYEVFLLSRVREQYNLTGDNTTAVAVGLQKTGGIITSAALLLMVVIGAFSTSGITTMKLIGIGMLIAIAVDATVIRVLLVPAIMRLLGKATWWAPSPLRRLHDRHGIREDDLQPTSLKPLKT